MDRRGRVSVRRNEFPIKTAKLRPVRPSPQRGLIT
jgi:hypothetical protein